MPKVALLALPRPERPAFTRTFTDPAQPGVEVELTLRRLDPCELAVAVDQAEAYHSRFGEHGFPLQNGSAVPLALSICQTTCMLQMMQAGEEDDRYTFEELVGLLANMPEAGVAAFSWATELNMGATETPEGNLAGAA